MTPEELELLKQVPTIAVLLYLVYKQQSLIDKLLDKLLAVSKENSNSLLQMVASGYDRRGGGGEQAK